MPVSVKLEVIVKVAVKAVEAEVIPYFSGWVEGGWLGGLVTWEVENIAISAFN